MRDIIQQHFQESNDFKSDINNQIQEWIDLYNGEPYGNEVDGKSKIVWKLIKKQGETLKANLIKPFITGSEITQLAPVNKNDVLKAKIDEKLINHFWEKEFNRVKFMRTLTSVNIKEGTAFIKVSWDKAVKRNKQVVGSLSQNQIQKFMAKGAKVRRLESGSYEISFEKIIHNRPHAQIIPNEDIFTDPLAYSVGESRYIIVRYPTTKEELLANPMYDETIVNRFFSRIETQKDASSADDMHDRELWRLDVEKQNETADKMFVYEYWYKEKNQVKIKYFLHSTGSEIDVIGSKDFDFNWYPFIAVPLFDKEFNIWGDALASIIEDEQKFMTSIVRGVIDNMSMSNNGTKFVRKGALDAVNYKRLMSGHPIVEVNSTGVPLNQVVLDGHFNELPSSVYNMLEIIEQQAQGLTGVNNTMAGISGKELNSPATNFSAMMSQAQVRLLDFTINIQEGLRQMFCKWLQMIMRYLSDEEIEKITGINIPELKAKETMKLVKEFGVDELPEDTKQKAMLLIMKEVNDIFNKEDVKYDIKFRIGTDGLKQIKVNQINMLMQQAGSLVQAGACPPDVIQKLLAKLTELLEYPELADEIANYQPQPDPTQQQMAQLEMMEKQAKAQKESALAQSALARTKATEVKAMKEQASIDADVANKYADVYKKINESEKDKNETSKTKSK